MSDAIRDLRSRCQSNPKLRALIVTRVLAHFGEEDMSILAIVAQERGCRSVQELVENMLCHGEVVRIQ